MKLVYLNSFFTKSVHEESDTSIEIEGFASTPDTDRAGDVILTSAWEKGIAEYLKNPVMLAFHNHNEPVGKMIDHKISGEGLWVKSKISSASGKVFNLVKEGVISAFSVGFSIKDAEFRPELDLFVIKELELHEISLVSVGMNSNTLFDLSKAFDSADELKTFKLQFTKESDSANRQDTDEVKSLENKEEWNMNEKDLEALLAKTAADAASAVIKAQSEAKAKEDVIAATKAAEEASIEARIEARVKAATSVVVGDSGAERLLADIEARFAKDTADNKSVLDGLQADIKVKVAELEAIQKSKMTFSNPGSEVVTYSEKEAAVILAKIMKKGIGDTKYGAGLVEKVGPHVASATWELEVSRNMLAEIRRKLVVAPLMRQVQMQTNVMTIPINPEAGVATWVTNAQFGTTASTGPAVTHQLSEITLNAYKVATLEYLNHEEEEDSLLVLLPMIRDAMTRRLARSVDIAFIRGAGAGADPVKGLALYDAAAATTVAVAANVTVANMIAMRKDLGPWGLDPAALIYVVSSDVYFDLLEDTSFQTVDKIGDRATLLTGQIGAIGNTPVIVSAEFEAKAATKTAAFVFAPENFVVGNQRGLRFDTDDLVETQRRVLVSSLRTGLVQTTTNLGAGISKLDWIA